MPRLTLEQLKVQLDRIEEEIFKRENEGDGSAVFLDDMTDAEFEQYQYEETHGWKGFINNIKNLGTEHDTTNQ